MGAERDRSPSASSAGWARTVDQVRWLGPGLVMAATAIGASHLVLAPTAGASFGYALLWVLLFSHLFKYPAFDFGPRYAVATGDSLLDGYRRVPGPRGWALWVFLAGTVVQGVTVLAGVLGVAAAVAAAAVPVLPLWAWSSLLGVACAWLLRTGGFDALSGLSKWMLLVLATLTGVAFLATPPPSSAWSRLAVPAVPDGSLMLLAAILGWMPTGIDVSVWHSLWALERTDVWADRAGRRRGRTGETGDTSGTAGRGAHPHPREGPGGPGTAGALRVGLADMRLGYGLSLILAVMFLVLGAEVLRPAELVPRGADVALTLGRLYTDVLGGWVLPFFLLAAFFGMFSSAYGVMDGFPRAFQETLRRLRADGDAGGRGAQAAGPAGDLGLFRPGVPYWGFLWVTLVLAVLEIVLLPDPVVLVTVAAVASFLLAPVTFALNYWCVTRLVSDPGLRPGRLLRGWALLGILFMAGASGLYLFLQIS